MSSDARRGDGDAPTVLLVEDDDDNRDLMTEVLESDGYRVVTAVSGAEALRILAARPVDVVVTDIGMPGAGGLEVARAAKAVEARTPVLVVTGYAEREDILAARGKEVDRILVKPVDPDALTTAVAEVVRARPFIQR